MRHLGAWRTLSAVAVAVAVAGCGNVVTPSPSVAHDPVLLPFPCRHAVADPGCRRIHVGPGRQPARGARQHARGRPGRRPRPRRRVGQHLHSRMGVGGERGSRGLRSGRRDVERDGKPERTARRLRRSHPGRRASARHRRCDVGRARRRRVRRLLQHEALRPAGRHVVGDEPSQRGAVCPRRGAPPRWEGARGRRHLRRRVGAEATSRAPRSMTPSSRAGRRPERSGRRAAGHGPSR